MTMKNLCLQITLLVTRQRTRKDELTTKKTSVTPLPGQLPLPFAKMSPPDNENHT